MTKEQKQEFTRRITTANRTGLVVIKYEMLLVYLEDATTEFKAGEKEKFRTEITNAEAVLESFRETLDFDYEISKSLYSIYTYCLEELAKAKALVQTERIEEVRTHIQPLYESYLEIEKQDDSAPVMSHSQQVYAGMTYGKDQTHSVTESSDSNRGFLA